MNARMPRLLATPALLLAAAGCATGGRPDPPAATVPVEVVENVVLVPATLNVTHGATLVLDTGASYTVLTPSTIRRLGLSVPDDAPRRSLKMVGGHEIHLVFVRLPALQIGDARVEDIEVGVHEIVPDGPSIDGLLGGDVLSRFTMTLDRSARKLRLEPYR
jgi:predicted aspartyl protease